MTFKVVEVDQWTSTGSVIKFSLAEWESDPEGTLAKVKGGDSEAARVIFGGHVRVLEVTEDQGPQIGNVWFREVETPSGKELRPWRSNYDSSD